MGVVCRLRRFVYQFRTCNKCRTGTREPYSGHVFIGPITYLQLCKAGSLCKVLPLILEHNKELPSASLSVNAGHNDLDVPLTGMGDLRIA